jgi:hypothetical protein
MQADPLPKNRVEHGKASGMVVRYACHCPVKDIHRCWYYSSSTKIMMFPDSYAPSCEQTLVGEAAFDWFLTDHEGKVLASVGRAVYLLGEGEELFWLATESSPMHRRCLRIASTLPRMQVGAGFQVRNGCLVTETGQALDFGRSPIWKLPLLPVGTLVPISSLGRLVWSVYRQFTAHKTPSGWGLLIPAILQTADGQAVPEMTGNGIFLPGKAWPAVHGIFQGCLAHDLDRILQHAAGLVGLGAGLTPSGDDFLGGLFFALALARCAYPEILDLQAWDYSNFILDCKSQTNLISYVLLKEHSEGHALEPLHGFANALLAGQPVDRSLPFAGQLAAVGNSTGWDLLTGFLAGMSIGAGL